MKILIIEDEPILARNIQKALQLEENYIAEVVMNGLDGLTKVQHEEFDCVICDVMLPEIDGFTICREVRKKGTSTPIILLTALDSIEKKVEGLDAGADDYLTKPFELKELMARVRALLRRDTPTRNPILSVDGIKFDTNKKQVTNNEKKVELSPKEFALFEFLLRNKGVAKNRIDIIKHVWGEREESLFSKTLDVHIAYLRQKLGKKVITTVPGTGYMIDDV